MFTPWDSYPLRTLLPPAWASAGGRSVTYPKTVVTSLQLAALATSAVRGLDVVATRAPQYATADFRYCGLLDGKGRHWIIQAPLHASASTAMELEVPLLHQLDRAVREDWISFDVVRPEGMAELPEGGRILVYRELAGQPLDIDSLHAGPGPTVSLAQAIAQIHELPIELFEAAHLPIYDADSYRRRRLAELDDAARTSFVPPVLLARWEHALSDVSLWNFAATPVHGDLAAENVFMSNGVVSGVVNWSSAHVGDPAEDLAWLYAAAPEESLDTLDEAYDMARALPMDDALGARATLYSELAVARWLLHGVHLDDREIITDAQRMLNDLAREVGDSDLVVASEEPEEQPKDSWSVSGSLGAPTAMTAELSALTSLSPDSASAE